MLSNAEQQEILRRRTFAIISHPDAGKTTLTEKLLLYGGAIHVAGAVKSNKIRKTATSDWMEIEKQRGISVATSVMGFDYNNYHINTIKELIEIVILIKNQIVFKIRIIGLKWLCQVSLLTFKKLNCRRLAWIVHIFLI